VIRRIIPPWATLALALLAGACTPVVIPAGPPLAPPQLAGDAVVAADGARLPMRVFAPEGPPRFVMLALHGFNDHSGNFLHDAGPLLTAGGALVYAYDQRGFGRSPNRGIWAGAETLAADATAAAWLLRARHPDLPLILMGESMGAAVSILAATSAVPPPVNAYVLLAPALWAREEMGPLIRGGLWLASRTIPIMGFQGGVGGITASDNQAALRRLGTDPLVVRSTRVDAAIGLVDLMDAAVLALPGCCRGLGGNPVPTLLLYGARDQIVQPGPTRSALRRIAPGSPIRLGVHEESWHLMLADANRDAVVRDILAFVAAPDGPLPSAADDIAPAWLARTR
jgi:alpha-beta hydrolase superfamily lysophospholipase